MTSLYLSLDLFNLEQQQDNDDDTGHERGSNDDINDEDRRDEQKERRFQLLTDLLETLACGALPQLQSLRLYSSSSSASAASGVSSGNGGGSISAPILARILDTHSDTLQTLIVTRCLHLATLPDTLVLAESLHQHPTLIQVKF